MSALSDLNGVVFEPIEDEKGFSEDEAYALLAGVEAPLVASSSPVHTGAMIALVPSDSDLERLGTYAEEPVDELHLTLAYLGEAEFIPDNLRQQIIATASQYFTNPITTEAFSVNVFNPHTDKQETALVLGVKGEDLVAPRNNVISAVRGMFAMPDNHEPWIPHVTMAYTDDVNRATDFVDCLGAVTFDKLRFAFGGEVTDIVLNESLLVASLGVNWEEMDISRLPPHLKAYWLGPKGSARVGGWGNEGSFRACQREMRKEGVPARMIDGLCANLYHIATGHTPNQKKISALTADGYVNELVEAAPAEEVPAYASWEGILTVEGVESGDGRLFSLGSLDWAQLPLPLMYQPANTGGHSGSVLVGQITNVVRKNNQLYGYGIIDLAAQHDGFEVGKEVYRLMSEEFLNGVSVDVDKVKDADVEFVYGNMPGDPIPAGKPKMTIFHRGRVRGATLVAFPAFVEAQIYLTGDVLTAAAAGITEIVISAARSGGWSKMPVADDGREWDKGEAIKRILSWAGDDISGKYARAFLWKDSDGDPNLQGSYKFPIADVIDGTLTIVPNAVHNAAARLEGSDIPAEDKTSMHSTIDGILERIHGPLTAAGHTITIPDLPPAWWFDEPKDVQMKGALTVTDEGRVYGLLAPKNTTHRAVKTKVPTRNVDYSRFMGRETIVEGGGRVVTGVITMGCGHAPTQNYGTLEDRIEHYNNSCSIAANIRIGETADGEVWVAGATAPFATGEQVSRMLACTLSGDWQPHPDRPGVREFIAALLVPVPGFAMARREASVTYEEGALVASTVPVEFRFNPNERRDHDGRWTDGSGPDLDSMSPREIIDHVNKLRKSDWDKMSPDDQKALRNAVRVNTVGKKLIDEEDDELTPAGAAREKIDGWTRSATDLLVAATQMKGRMADRMLREMNLRKQEMAKRLGRNGQDV